MEESSAEPPTAERLSKEKFCHHCNAYVSRRTFYRHQEEFFDPITSVWRLSKDIDRDTNVSLSEMIERNHDDMETGIDVSNEWVNFNSEVEDDDGVTNCNFNDDCYQENTSWERPLDHEETTSIEIRPEGTICMTQDAKLTYKMLWRIIKEFSVYDRVLCFNPLPPPLPS